MYAQCATQSLYGNGYLAGIKRDADVCAPDKAAETEATVIGGLALAQREIAALHDEIDMLREVLADVLREPPTVQGVEIGTGDVGRLPPLVEGMADLGCRMVQARWRLASLRLALAIR